MTYCLIHCKYCTWVYKEIKANDCVLPGLCPKCGNVPVTISVDSKTIIDWYYKLKDN